MLKFFYKNSTFAKPASLKACTDNEEQVEQDISALITTVVELSKKLDHAESLETCTDNDQQDVPVAITKIELAPWTPLTGAIPLPKGHEHKIVAVQNTLVPDGKSPPSWTKTPRNPRKSKYRERRTTT